MFEKHPLLEESESGDLSLLKLHPSFPVLWAGEELQKGRTAIFTTILCQLVFAI
jgi:hypothetical protein